MSWTLLVFLMILIYHVAQIVRGNYKKEKIPKHKKNFDDVWIIHVVIIYRILILFMLHIVLTVVRKWKLEKTIHHEKVFDDALIIHNVDEDEKIQELINQLWSLASYMIDMYYQGKLDHIGKKDALEQKIENPYNKERHEKNKLPKKATLDERVKWHIAHVANCKCRPIPNTIKKEIQKRIG